MSGGRSRASRLRTASVQLIGTASVAAAPASKSAPAESRPTGSAPTRERQSRRLMPDCDRFIRASAIPETIGARIPSAGGLGQPEVAAGLPNTLPELPALFQILERGKARNPLTRTAVTAAVTIMALKLRQWPVCIERFVLVIGINPGGWRLLIYSRPASAPAARPLRTRAPTAVRVRAPR